MGGVAPLEAGQARAHVARFVARPPVVVGRRLGLAPHGHGHRGVEDDPERDQHAAAIQRAITAPLRDSGMRSRR